jgi:hypothetical protein
MRQPQWDLLSKSMKKFVATSEVKFYFVYPENQNILSAFSDRKIGAIRIKSECKHINL